MAKLIDQFTPFRRAKGDRTLAVHNAVGAIVGVFNSCDRADAEKLSAIERAKAQP